MHLYITLFSIPVPTYGLCIIAGFIVANILAIRVIRLYVLDVNEFILVQTYAFAGGFLGAKILYLLVNAHAIEWGKLIDWNYAKIFAQGGFVFYGGLIGGSCASLLAKRLHKVRISSYTRPLLFMLPLIHGFGRIGCHCAGCCYGVPYAGPFSVTYSSGLFAPRDTPLFPVQLTEASFLFLLSGVLLIGSLRKKDTLHYGIYLVCYSAGRFALEFLRHDAARGHLAFLSTSQWISAIAFIVGICIIASVIRKGGVGRRDQADLVI